MVRMNRVSVGGFGRGEGRRIFGNEHKTSALGPRGNGVQCKGCFIQQSGFPFPPPFSLYPYLTQTTFIFPIFSYLSLFFSAAVAVAASSSCTSSPERDGTSHYFTPRQVLFLFLFFLFLFGCEFHEFYFVLEERV